jgi:hypothetical protein
VSSSRVFDIRTYTSAPGKRELLKARFDEYTIGFFIQHGMELVAFFEPLDDEDTLVYILAYPDEEAANRSWEGFQADPGWAAAKKSTEIDGPLAIKIQTRRFRATDFSPLK